MRVVRTLVDEGCTAGPEVHGVHTPQSLHRPCC
jgi:hypothetical protein